MEDSQCSSKDGQKKAFLDGLNRFLIEKGKPLLKYPLLAGKWIDLHDLYNRVTTYGGCDKVSRLELWDEILTAYGFPYCSPLAFGLQELYKKYLEDYERVHFFGEDNFSNLLRSPETRRSYSSFTLPPPPAMRFNQPTRRGKHSSSYDRVVLSLLSCLPNEVDFAVNACTLLSGESRHVLKLPQCPRIIDALLMHAGFFPTDYGNYNELVTEFCNNTGHDLLQFWLDSVEDKTVLKSLLPVFSNSNNNEENNTNVDLSSTSGSVTPMEDSQNAVDVEFWQRNLNKLNPKCPRRQRSKQNLRQDVLLTTLAEKLKTAFEESSNNQQDDDENEDEKISKKSWSYLFHNRRKLGIADYEGQRILQIALVLLNLSFEDFNVPLLANHQCFFRFTLLCISSKYASLRQTGLDILSNISPMVDITCMDHQVIDLLFDIIHETSDASDKFELIKGFDVLGNLCRDKNNANMICIRTNNEFYKRAVELLLLCDVEVVLAAIEVLYRLSKLGEASCTKIALIINSIEILMSLLTLNVGMFGPESLKNIRIAKRIVQGATVPPPPQNPQLQNAQKHNIQMAHQQRGYPQPQVMVNHNPNFQTRPINPQMLPTHMQPTVYQQTPAMPLVPPKHLPPPLLNQTPIKNPAQTQVKHQQPTTPVALRHQPTTIQPQHVAMQQQPVAIPTVAMQPSTAIQQHVPNQSHVPPVQQSPAQKQSIPLQKQCIESSANSSSLNTSVKTSDQQAVLSTNQPQSPLLIVPSKDSTIIQTDKVPESPKSSKSGCNEDNIKPPSTPEGAGATYTHREINASPPVFHYMPAPPNKITLDSSADSFTKLWIWATYEICPGNYIPRVEVYAEYVASSSRYGRHSKEEVSSATDFGKCLKHVFPNATSRLFNQGRGHPQYHIAGIKKRATPLPVPGHHLKDPIMITPPCSPAAKRNISGISSPTSKLNVDLRTGEIINDTVTSHTNNCTNLPQGNKINEAIFENKLDIEKNENNDTNCENNLKRKKSIENSKNNLPKPVLQNGIGEQKKKPAIIDALMKMNGIISPEKDELIANGDVNATECQNGIADESDIKIVNNMLNKVPSSPERVAVIKSESAPISNGTCEHNEDKDIKTNEINEKLSSQNINNVDKNNTTASAVNDIATVKSSNPSVVQKPSPVVTAAANANLKRKAPSPLHSNIPNKITANPTPIAPPIPTTTGQNASLITKQSTMNPNQSVPMIQNNVVNQKVATNPVNTQTHQKPPQTNSKHPSIDLMAPNASLMVLLRNVGKIPIRNHLDEGEDPITKSIRLTSALILRNIAKHSHFGRSRLQKHEGSFANIAMSKMDCSPVVAKILQEMNT